MSKLHNKWLWYVLFKLIFKVWCSQENKCKFSENLCQIYNVEYFGDNQTHNYIDIKDIPDQMEYFRPSNFDKSYWDNYIRFNFPISCQGYQIISKKEKCPSFNSKKFIYLSKVKAISTKNINAVNLIGALNIQPGVTLEDSVNGSNFLNSTWLNYYTTIPGYYFIQKPTNDSKVFSMLFDFIQRFWSGPFRSPYFFFNTEKKIEFLDVALVGARGTYQLGYSLIIQKNQTFECAYTVDPYTVNLTMVYESFYGPLTIAAFVACIILYLIFALIVFFCKYKNTDTINDNNYYIKKDVSYRIFEKQNRFFDILYSMFIMSDEQACEHIGKEAIYYLRFYRLFILFLTLCSGVSVCLIFIDAFATPNLINSQDVSKLSIAVINPGDYKNGFRYQSYVIIAHLTAAILYIIIGFIFNIFVLRLSRTIFDQKKDDEAISRQTVMIRNLPTYIIDEKELLEHFISQFPKDDILKVTIAYDLSQLSLEFQKIEMLKKKILEFQNKRIRKQPYQRWWYTKEQIDEKINGFETEIREIETKIQQSNKEPKGSGYAFIIFSSEEKAKKCIENYSNPYWRTSHQSIHSKIYQMNKWEVTEAPKTSTIYWDNLPFTRIARVSRIIFGNAILVLAFFLAGLFGFLLSSSTILRSSFTKALGWLIDQTNVSIKYFFSGYGVFLDLSPVWTLVILFATVPMIIINTKWQKHTTSIRERRYLTHSFLFYLFLNSVLMPRIFLFLLGLLISFIALQPFSNFLFINFYRYI